MKSSYLSHVKETLMKLSEKIAEFFDPFTKNPPIVYNMPQENVGTFANQLVEKNTKFMDQMCENKLQLLPINQRKISQFSYWSV